MKHSVLNQPPHSHITSKAHQDSVFISSIIDCPGISELSTRIMAHAITMPDLEELPFVANNSESSLLSELFSTPREDSVINGNFVFILTGVLQHDSSGYLLRVEGGKSYNVDDLVNLFERIMFTRKIFILQVYEAIIPNQITGQLSAGIEFIQSMSTKISFMVYESESYFFGIASNSPFSNLGFSVFDCMNSIDYPCPLVHSESDHRYCTGAFVEIFSREVKQAPIYFHDMLRYIHAHQKSFNIKVVCSKPLLSSDTSITFTAANAAVETTAPWLPDNFVNYYIKTIPVTGHQLGNLVFNALTSSFLEIKIGFLRRAASAAYNIALAIHEAAKLLPEQKLGRIRFQLEKAKLITYKLPDTEVDNLLALFQPSKFIRDRESTDTSNNV